MVLTNLGQMLDRAIDAARKGTALQMKPAKEKKGIATRTRRNGSSERSEKGAAKAKEKEKEKVKGKQKAAGIGKENAKLPCTNYNKGNGYCKFGDNCRFSHEGTKGGSKNTRPWPFKALRRNKRKQ